MQTNQVSKTEFKAKALEYFRQVEASGETLVVTDHASLPWRCAHFGRLNGRPWQSWLGPSCAMTTLPSQWMSSGRPRSDHS